MTNELSKLKIERPLLLPEVPDARDRCVRTLIGLLSARDGLAEAHVVAAEGTAPAQLCIHEKRTGCPTACGGEEWAILGWARCPPQDGVMARMMRWCGDEQRMRPMTRHTIWYGRRSIARGC